MGKVIVPGGEGGVAAFLNLALKAYLQANPAGENVDALSKCVHRDSVSIYLADMRLPEPGAKGIGEYDLVAVNEKGQTRCFQVQCDAGLQVKSVGSTKLRDLLPASKAMYEDLRREHETPATESEAAPTGPR